MNLLWGGAGWDALSAGLFGLRDQDCFGAIGPWNAAGLGFGETGRMIGGWGPDFRCRKLELFLLIDAGCYPLAGLLFLRSLQLNMFLSVSRTLHLALSIEKTFKTNLWGSHWQAVLCVACKLWLFHRLQYVWYHLVRSERKSNSQ